MRITTLIEERFIDQPNWIKWLYTVAGAAIVGAWFSDGKPITIVVALLIGFIAGCVAIVLSCRQAWKQNMLFCTVLGLICVFDGKIVYANHAISDHVVTKIVQETPILHSLHQVGTESGQGGIGINNGTQTNIFNLSSDPKRARVGKTSGIGLRLGSPNSTFLRSNGKNAHIEMADTIGCGFRNGIEQNGDDFYLKTQNSHVYADCPSGGVELHAGRMAINPVNSPPPAAGPNNNSGGQNAGGNITNTGPVYNGPVTITPPPTSEQPECVAMFDIRKTKNFKLNSQYNTLVGHDDAPKIVCAEGSENADVNADHNTLIQTPLPQQQRPQPPPGP